jgi:protein-serine/threonine kinase
MLAGYLPFDDDPANPEGDNINLLYKYIVSTPLTFPEYVTPHARDLLRRILVPDPRKRADLFEVARHSWLSDYAHVVGFITSTTTTSGDIGSTSIGVEDHQEIPLLGRSASVREASKAKSPTAVGDLSRKHGNVDQEVADVHPKVTKDNKRRTVQVEYVPPRSQTQRGEQVTAPAPARARGPAGIQGPVDGQTGSRRAITEKPLPQDPPVTRDAQYPQGRGPSSSQRQQGMVPARPGREPPRSVSDATHLAGSALPPVSMARPATGGSMASSRSKSGALPHHGSYGQPAAPAVAGTNAQGRMAQPKTTRGYDISAPVVQSEAEFGQPSVSQVRGKSAGVTDLESGQDQKGHKRSSTIGSIFGRTNSIFGSKRNTEEAVQEKSSKKYPPVSMSGAVGNADNSRQSTESRRSTSFGFGKKRSGSISGSQTTLQDRPARRFSLLPASFSLKAIGIGKEAEQQHEQRPDSRRDYVDRPNPQYAQQTRNVSGSTAGSYHADAVAFDRRAPPTTSPPQHQRHVSQPIQDPRSGVPPQFLPPLNFRQDQSALTTESESSLNDMTNRRAQYPPGFGDYEERKPSGRVGSSGRGVLQKTNRKFTEAYEPQENAGWGGQPHIDHAGSSGAARKVMDFFRRRGRDRQ